MLINHGILFFFFFFRGQELVEEDIDWWSKYYASLSDYDKCGDYIERGYDKIIVCTYKNNYCFSLAFFISLVRINIGTSNLYSATEIRLGFIECSLPHKVRKTQI